jgi:salicylate hydroxylase
MMSTASLTVEDSSALGVLLSHIPSVSALPSLLTGYQDVRQKTSETTWAAELRYLDLLRLPPGPERDARDLEMRSIWDNDQEPTEDELRENWEKLGILYAHDATEAAEDWWLKWGRLSV